MDQLARRSTGGVAELVFSPPVHVDKELDAGVSHEKELSLEVGRGFSVLQSYREQDAKAARVVNPLTPLGNLPWPWKNFGTRAMMHKLQRQGLRHFLPFQPQREDFPKGHFSALRSRKA